MPKFLKLCNRPFKNASRDEREMQAALEAGYEVDLLSLGNTPREDGLVQTADGIKRHTVYPAFTSDLFVVKLWQFLTLRKPRIWFKTIRKIGADVISCHDLYALRMAFFAYIFVPKNKKPKLIYDSHEFELGRNASRTPFKAWQIKCWERFLIKRSALVIMVNESIADEVTRIYNLKQKPLVIRSTPPKWKLDSTIIAQRRREIEKKANAPANSFLVMYHGLITTNRGVEKLIEAVQVNPHITGIIMGPDSPGFLRAMETYAQKLKVENRILFLPAAPIEQLWEYVGAADVGIMLIQNAVLSYYYSLPNKLFENVQSLTPVIASNFPEYDKIVAEYKIGLTCNPADPHAINDCIEKMRTDKAFYAQCKRNLQAARNDLCWENEKKPLVEALKAL